MEADAVLRRSSIELAALRAVAAGADILLLTGAGQFPAGHEAASGGRQGLDRFRARIAEAAARVIALKRIAGTAPG